MFNSNDDKMVYVPQGRSAKLLNGVTDTLGIVGAYTDGFSICNIIVGIGAAEIFLMHVDMRTVPELVETSIKTITNLSELIIYYREGQGNHTKNEIYQYFSTKNKNIKITTEKVDRRHEGIAVYFQKQSGQVHSDIKRYETKPHNIIHHPQEQQITAVQKIQALIGMRASHQTSSLTITELSVFTDFRWAVFDGIDINIDQSHPKTREEMSLFSTNDTFLKLAGKVGGLRKQLINSGVPILDKSQNEVKKDNDPTILENYIFPITFWLESYLGNYNHHPLFKRNLNEILEFYTPQTNLDKALKSNIKNLFIRQDDVFNDVENCVKTYEKNTENTEFKTKFLSEYNTFAKHYRDRKFYFDLQNESVKMYGYALQRAAIALQAYKDGKYEVAASLYLETVKIYTYYYCLDLSKSTSLLDNIHKSFLPLALAHYNYGKCLFQLKKYPEAKAYLELCLFLRKDARAQPEDIQKVEKAIADCQAKMQ